MITINLATAYFGVYVQNMPMDG